MVDDHPSGYGPVGRLVDQDKTAGRTVAAVLVHEQRCGQPQAVQAVGAPDDVVQAQDGGAGLAQVAAGERTVRAAAGGGSGGGDEQQRREGGEQQAAGAWDRAHGDLRVGVRSQAVLLRQPGELALGASPVALRPVLADGLPLSGGGSVFRTSLEP